MVTSRVSIFPSAMAATLYVCASVAFAGPESTIPAAPNGVPVLQGAGGQSASVAAGEVYEEYFNYSSYAKRSYSPGYTPHVSSLFENPRDYPWALGALATPYYQYAGTSGWFFGSPKGYQSSVPPNSQAHAYFAGQLGITSNLRYGYPDGLRVIEPVVVPVSASVKKGGLLITGGSALEVEVAKGTEVSAPLAAPAPLAPPPPAPPAPALDRELLEK
jgi:hypothetical protein